MAKINFKLTVKDWDDKELDPDFVKKLMKTLYQDFELLDDPDSCNCELSELFTERQIKDISLMVNGNDFPSSVHVLKELILVGAKRDGGFCPNCGHEDYDYVGGIMYCDKCKHSEPPEDDISFVGDIGGYEGRIAL